MMHHLPASIPSDDDMKEAALVLQGYTVSTRGRCMTRIGAEYVMRDGAHHCVRIPVATSDAAMLGAEWAEFHRPVSVMEGTPVTREATWSGAVTPKDVALVLQGYAVSARGVCLARVAGNYVTRDGLRRCIRFLVDTVDPVTLGAAWAAFSGAAGWVGAASMGHAETLNQPIGQWADTGEQSRASG
jgi:hypothetical protein